MTDLFGSRPLQRVARDVFEMLGKRASHDDLVSGVSHQLTMAEYQEFCDRAFRGAVISAVKGRRQDPADEVYSLGGGVLAALRLFSVAEYEMKGRELAMMSAANRDRVYDLAEVCREVNGETFDADAVCERAGIARREAG